MSAAALQHYEAAHAAQAAAPADWLRTLRQRGIAAFTRAGFPTLKDEAWKYTSLQSVQRRRFAPAQGATLAPAVIERLLLSGLPPGPRLVFVNGRFLAAASQTAGAPGLRVTSLAQRLQAEPGTPPAALGARVDLEAHRFAALNTAFLGDGASIELAEGAAPDTPVYLVFISAAEAEEALVQPRVLIEAARGSRATVIEHYVSAGAPANLTNVVTELTVGPQATIEHYSVLEQGEADFHIAGLHARLERAGRLTAHSLSAGARLARRDLHCVLAGEEAELNLDGLFLAATRRHSDQHLRIEHAVPHTRSHTDYRGIAEAHGRGVFSGKVVVARDAQRTDAHQSSRNLLLAPQAEIDARPELEIYADDVKCSHGATVGQLDPAAMFYLRTRGIGEAHARALLTYAFAQPIVQRCALEPVRARFVAALVGTLPDAAALQELA